MTLDEVAELAREEGESDPWLLAARYAAAMLPGIFKTADPCVRLPLAPEGRKALEDILARLPSEVFTADDALGWVYQFWQTKKKKEVNASERKIGGADLAPVTQLFTEHYMVRFLLENSLGAWWAARHPQSPLLAEWEYLRFADDGTPAAGSFEGWPATAAEVTVMDPCCGSGHFLVAAFEMLRKMREEEEGLSIREAADAVLADNLFGLELDPRCIQLGAFALALAAWKTAGYHELPALNLACSGIPTRGSLEEWTKLAKGDQRLERALTRLHELFKEADTLGSLIDPRRAVEDGTLESVPFEEVAPLLEKALAGDPDPVAAVFNDGAREVAKAATLLAGSYTLVATNVPYLSYRRMSEIVKVFVDGHHSDCRWDLATSFLDRMIGVTQVGGTYCAVAPQSWLSLTSYSPMRARLLADRRIALIARLGTGAFEAISGEVVNVGLFVLSSTASRDSFCLLDCQDEATCHLKRTALQKGALAFLSVAGQLRNPDSRVATVVDDDAGEPAWLYRRCDSVQGMTSGDSPRFVRRFWEVATLGSAWERLRSTVPTTTAYGGCEMTIHWEDGRGELERYAKQSRETLHDAHRRGSLAWGKRGVAISQMGSLAATLYRGELFDSNIGVLVPRSEEDIPALWAFCSSPAYPEAVRRIDTKMNVTNGNLVKVPFDLDHWNNVAAEQYPTACPNPTPTIPPSGSSKATSSVQNSHSTSPSPACLAIAGPIRSRRARRLRR